MITIENYQEPHYFSEKIMDPLLCNCVPIYLGCKNINSYFPNMVINLSNNIDEDFELIKKIHGNPMAHKLSINIDNVKDTICIRNLIQKYFIQVRKD